MPRISVEELVAEMRKEGFQWRYIGRQITFTAVVTTAGPALRVRIEGMDNGKAVLHPLRYENSAKVGQKVKVRGLLTDQCYGVWQVWCYEISVVNEPGAPAVGGGVEGTVVRPKQAKAKVEGCSISKPGEYAVAVGDLIELEYTYPIVPAAIPKKVAFKEFLITQQIVESSLRIRTLSVPGKAETGSVVFFLEAQMAGDATVTLKIDDAEYVFKFKVSDNKK